MHGMIAMRGRPRKDGPRYPSGKLKPPKQQRETGWTPSHIRRALDNSWVLANNPVLHSEIGLMLMRKELTPREASAAFNYAYRVGKRDRVLDGAPRRTTKSQAFEIGFSSGGSYGEEIDRITKAEIEEAADEVENCIPIVPRIARECMEMLCLDNHPINGIQLPGVKAILNRMANKMKLAVQDETAKPAGRQKGDESLYGAAAVDALEAKFAELQCVATEFSVLAMGGIVRLYVVGHKRETGEVMGLKADFEVIGMLGAQLVDRLTMFAKAKGWKRRGK